MYEKPVISKFMKPQIQNIDRFWSYSVYLLLFLELRKQTQMDMYDIFNGLVGIKRLSRVLKYFFLVFYAQCTFICILKTSSKSNAIVTLRRFQWF